MSWDADQDAFASLLLTAGVQLQPGQGLELSFPPDYLDFARLLTAQAYRRGAKYVALRILDPLVTRARVEGGRREAWSFVPAMEQALADHVAGEGWARIFLEDNENSQTLKSLNPEDVELLAAPLREARKTVRAACMKDLIPWCVAVVPGAAWAREVFGRQGRSFAPGRAGDEEAQEALWQVLKPIYRLDQPDPLAAWKAWGRQLETRRERLQALQLKELHFQGPGTDLRVGLTSRALWIAAESRTPDGQPFWANLPTEEVYTTPDARLTEGRAAFTRPVEVNGVMVEGGWLEFKSGRVEDFGADQGQEALKAYLDTDDGARRLGEVALVGTDSPLFQSGLIFGSGLLDENASCHIALGEAYPTALKDGESLEGADLAAWGCNVSQLHTDFMISSPRVDVWGTRADGSRIPLLRQGCFVLD